MTYREVECNLFEVNENLSHPNEELYCLAHCISADFAMMGGIVIEFNKRWDMKGRLVDFYGNVTNKFQRTGGFCIPEMVTNSKDEPFPVFNLVTKCKVSDHPTYTNIEKSLEDVVLEMEFKQCHKIAMPTIGCGIDGKDWAEVSRIIQKVFSVTDIDVLICKHTNTHTLRR